MNKLTAFEAFVNGCWIVASVLLLVFIVLLVICIVYQALEMSEMEKERERVRESKDLEFDTLDAWEIDRVTRRLLREDKKRSKKRGYAW